MQDNVEQIALRLSALIDRQLGLGGRDPAVVFRKAGRRLSRGARRDLLTLAQALPMAGHPKLMRQLDHAALAAAERRVSAELQAYDAKDRRWGALLGVLGSLAFSILVVAALVVVILVWRDLV